MKSTSPSTSLPAFLQGGGDAAIAIQKGDWSSSHLGPPSGWPDALRCQLAFLLHAATPMLLFWGPDRLCFYNDRYRDKIGKEASSPGRPAAEVLGGDWNLLATPVASALHAGTGRVEVNQLIGSGVPHPTYWTLNFNPVFDGQGAAAGVLVNCTETTDLVRLAHTLEHTNETARLAIEAGELGVVEVDLRTEEVVISRRIEELFGLKSGSPRTDFLLQMHPEDLVLREEAYRRAFEDGRLEYESRVFHKNGSTRWIRLKGTVFFDAEHRPLKMVSVVQDITDQKNFSEELSRQVGARTGELEHAHALLLASNRYLQDIINVFQSALQVLEPVVEEGEIVDFTYKLTNRAYAAYAGREPEDLVGQRVSTFFPGYFQTDSFRNIREVAQTGEAKIWENHYAADGLDIYNQMGAVKMGQDIIVHLNDFTSLKQLQLELLRNIKELERSNQNLEEFAHAASHDLKEPIRKIHFFTGQLKNQLEGQLTEAQTQSFERIEKASHRMGTLVEDLLMYSHVSQLPHAMERVNLEATIQRVREDLELDIRDKAASVEVGILPELMGYRRQLQQLFQNLISNAVKYSRPGVPPRIQISADQVEREGQVYHRIAIRDNGIGFENIYNEKIFQMFTRLHGKQEYSGTGVGLSIVKKVVDNHKGWIEARGEPGQGALFLIHLPA